MVTTNTISDKRAGRRISMVLPSRIQSVSGNGHAIVDGCTRDVSNRGAYLFLEQNREGEWKLDVGDLLHVRMSAPPDRGRLWTIDIECEAEVVRIDLPDSGHAECGIGVRIRNFRIPKVVVLPRARALSYVPTSAHLAN